MLSTISHRNRIDINPCDEILKIISPDNNQKFNDESINVIQSIMNDYRDRVFESNELTSTLKGYIEVAFFHIKSNPDIKLDVIDMILSILSLKNCPESLIKPEYIKRILEELQEHVIQSKIDNDNNRCGLYGNIMSYLYDIVDEKQLSCNNLINLFHLCVKVYYHNYSTPLAQVKSMKCMQDCLFHIDDREKDLFRDVILEAKGAEFTLKRVISNIRCSITNFSFLIFGLVDVLVYKGCENIQNIIVDTVHYLINNDIKHNNDDQLEILIQDSLLVLTNPRYPSSLTIIEVISKYICSTLLKKGVNNKKLFKFMSDIINRVSKIEYSLNTLESIVIPTDVFIDSGLTKLFIEEDDNDKQSIVLNDGNLCINAENNFPQEKNERVMCQFMVLFLLSQDSSDKWATKSLLQLWSTYSDIDLEDLVNRNTPAKYELNGKEKILNRLYEYLVRQTQVMDISSLIVTYLIRNINSSDSKLYNQSLKQLITIMKQFPVIISKIPQLQSIVYSLYSTSKKYRDELLDIILISLKTSCHYSYFRNVIINTLKNTNENLSKTFMNAIANEIKNSRFDDFKKKVFETILINFDGYSSKKKVIGYNILSTIFYNSEDKTSLLQVDVLDRCNSGIKIIQEIEKCDPEKFVEFIDNSMESVRSYPEEQEVKMMVMISKACPFHLEKHSLVICEFFFDDLEEKYLMHISRILYHILIYNFKVPINKKILEILRKLIGNGKKQTVKKIVKLYSLLSQRVYKGDDFLEKCYLKCYKVIQSSDKDIIPRAFFTIGCIFKYNCISTIENVDRHVFEKLLKYIKQDSTQYTLNFISILCDFCLYKNSFIEESMKIMSHFISQEKGFSEIIIKFLCKLVDREASSQSTDSIYSTSMIQSFLNKILDHLISSDRTVKALCVSLLHKSITYGKVNTSQVTPYILTQILDDEVRDSALKCVSQLQFKRIFESLTKTCDIILANVQTFSQNKYYFSLFDFLAYFPEKNFKDVITFIGETSLEYLKNDNIYDSYQWFMSSLQRIHFPSYSMAGKLYSTMTSIDTTLIIKNQFRALKKDNTITNLTISCIIHLMFLKWFSDTYKIHNKDITELNSKPLSVKKFEDFSDIKEKKKKKLTRLFHDLYDRVFDHQNLMIN